MGEEILVCCSLANLYCTRWSSFSPKTPSEIVIVHHWYRARKDRCKKRPCLARRDAVSVLLGNHPLLPLPERFPVKRLPSSFSENCLLSAFSCQLGDGEGVGSQNLLLPLWFEIGHLNFVGDHLVGEVWADGPLSTWTCWYTHTETLFMTAFHNDLEAALPESPNDSENVVVFYSS